MPILFFIYLEKIANIRKYRNNDEYFPYVNSIKCTGLVCFTTHYSQPYAGLNFEIWEIAAVWPSHLQASWLGWP